MRFDILPDLGRMLREQSTRLRRVVFGWLRREDARHGRLWATSGDDARALFEEFAAIQHYIWGDEGNFLKSLNLARGFTGSEPGNTSRTGLLLDVLEANQLVRHDKIEAAADRYARRIQQEEGSYRAMLRRRQRPDARRELLEQRQVLGLLELNLAKLLSRKPTHLGEVERHCQKACAYMPSSTYAHRCYAEFLLSRKDWEQAMAKFREAYTEGGFEDTSSALNADLAWAYREWARWVNRPAEPESPPEASDTAVSSLGRQSFRAFRGLLSRLAGEAARAGLQSAPAPPHVSTLRGPSAALDQLNEALRTLKWKDIPIWEGAIRFEWASILESEKIPERAKDVSDAFLESAQRYSEARDPSSSALAFERAGDVLVKPGLVKDAIAAYENGLKQAESIDREEDRLNQRKRDKVDALLSKLAITRLGVGDQLAAAGHFDRLTEQWWREGARWGGESWGPYYDVLSQATALLENVMLRHPVNVLYHQLLRESTDLKLDRDLTAALLKLYEFERKDLEARPDDDKLLDDPSSITDNLNVVTPLAIEISEDFVDRVVFDDSVAKRHASPMRNSINEGFGVRIPGVRVRSSPELRDGEYVIMIHEVPLARGMYIGDDVGQAFRHLEVLIVANLVEFVGHQEVQNYLERNLLVQPTVEDISQKENCRHMDPLSNVFRALVAERVPLMGSWKFSTADIKDLPSLAMKLKQEADAVSKFLRSQLSSTTQQALADYDSDGSDQGMLRGALVDDLNNVIENQEVYEEQRFHHARLRPETQQILAQDDTVKDLRLFNRLLLEDAYRDELTKGPLTYSREIYQTFRSGWEGGLPLAEIVENIRRIPQVRDRLWGNDGSYDYLFLPPSFESWVESCVRPSGEFRVLVIDPEQGRCVLGALADRLRVYGRPALVVRRQDKRALVRQLIAAGFPEVPVLSVQELLPGASRISALSDLPIPQSELP